MNDVDREAMHDWLDVRDSLDDDRPTRAEAEADSRLDSSYPRRAPRGAILAADFHAGPIDNDDCPF